MVFNPWALLIAIPPLIAMPLLCRKAKTHDALKREPFKDAVLRPPGESCRKKVMALEEEIPTLMLWFCTPLIFALVTVYVPTHPIGCMILALVSLGMTLHLSKKLWSLRDQLRNYQVGFEGERLVGQVINQALAQGCRVYHDVQFEGYNIDHVIVAPAGVYAVETKTRRKGLEAGSHKVKYDGQKLIYPGWDDTYGLDQAERNAKSLAIWLSSAVGEPVTVKPILTLPGWFIERIGKGRVHVLTPKEILKFVTPDVQAVLSPQLIQRIAHQIEQRSVIS